MLLLTTDNGIYSCSGSLVAPQWVLTAAHCIVGVSGGTVQFAYTANVALETRNVVSYVQAPGWDGTRDSGADLALIKLDSPVTTLPVYKLSTTNDVGKTYLMTGYGVSGTGYQPGPPSNSDSAYGHYGYNTFDATSDEVESAWDAVTGEGIYNPPTYGHLYVSDFDPYGGTPQQAAQYDTLQRIATFTGGTWANNQGLGKYEALAGADDGGGDFIWNGHEWLLSAVQSWRTSFCDGRFGPGTVGGGLSCDYRMTTPSSYGDLSGAIAVYEHIEWIHSVISASN